MCVCLCVCMCVCVHARARMLSSVSVYVSVCACGGVCVCVCARMLSSVSVYARVSYVGEGTGESTWYLLSRTFQSDEGLSQAGLPPGPDRPRAPPHPHFQEGPASGQDECPVSAGGEWVSNAEQRWDPAWTPSGHRRAVSWAREGLRDGIGLGNWAG